MWRRLVLFVLVALVASVAPAAAAGPPLSASFVGEPPNGDGVFRFPQAVGFSPGGRVAYVGDQYSGVVQAFGADGGFRFAFGGRATRGELGRLGVVGGVAVDRAGRVYVLDAENERVQIFDSDGSRPRAFGNATVFNLLGGDPATGAGISASGLAVAQASPSAAPVVYVADQGNDRVARFQLDPTTLAPTGPPQFSARDFAAPQGVALDPAATRLYVADDDHHRVAVLDPATLAPIAQVGTFGTGPGQFQNPYDVAVDDHDPQQLYVADNLNNRVDVFDAAGLGFLAIFGRPGYGPGLGNMEIVRSVGALADTPGGGVAATDTANNRVQLFDAAGTVVSAWGIAGRGAGYVTRPRGVTFTPDGGVAVADSFDHRVTLFAGDGTFAGLRGLVSPSTGFATAGAAPGQFRLPAGVAAGADGTLWVADTGNDRAVQLAADGAVLRTIGGLSGPLSVAAGTQGDAYVADTGNNRVLHVAADGSTTSVGAGFTSPAAVAVGPSGTPYVADDTSVRQADTGTAIAGPGGGATWDHPAGLAVSGGTLYVSERRPGTANGARVVRRSPDQSWDTVATEGTGAGQVIEPAGLAVSPDGGTLLVADTGNNRVLRLDDPGHGPPPVATLRVGIDQPARGTVTSDLPGIACVTDCRQGFGVGRAVTLTARPAAGSVVSGWTGACTPAGAAPACTVAMTADQFAGVAFAVAPPPPAAPPPPPPPPPPVQIRGVRIQPRVLHRARRADRRRHRRARRATRAAVTVLLTRPATLTAMVLEGRPGRRQGSQCRPVTRANRRGRPCTRFVALRRRRTVAATATTARFTLTPAFAGPELRPGSYRLAITALDPDGNRVGPAVAGFRVTR